MCGESGMWCCVWSAVVGMEHGNEQNSGNCVRERGRSMIGNMFI